MNEKYYTNRFAAPALFVECRLDVCEAELALAGSIVLGCDGWKCYHDVADANESVRVGQACLLTAGQIQFSIQTLCLHQSAVCSVYEFSSMILIKCALYIRPVFEPLCCVCVCVCM